LRAEESVLRTRILPGLLRSVAHNHARGLTDVALFEMGRVFLAPPEGSVLPEEPNHLASALAGTVHRRPVEADRPIDAFDAVDALRAVFAALEIAAGRTQAAERPGFTPGRAASVVVDDVDIGVVGELDERLLRSLELMPPVVGFELDLDRLLAASRRDRMFRPPSPYPPSTIDLAFVVTGDVAAGDVAATLRAAAGQVLEDVRLFDVFRSDALGGGHKSLAFALRFRAPDHTLTDDEVGEVRRRCVEAATREHNAELRG
jgi:phenylalanyl-tRNA synthetase beta chain